MWASTLCPLSSSTRKKAFGSDSTTVPSISMAPSFLGISSAFHFIGRTAPAAARLSGSSVLAGYSVTWWPAGPLSPGSLNEQHKDDSARAEWKVYATGPVNANQSQQLI